MEEKISFMRQVARKTQISEIVTGEYIQETEQAANYLLTKNQEKLYRVNLIGIVIDKEKSGSITNMLLDDGSGQLSLRVFEEINHVEKIQVGDVVLVIGKLRTYNEEKYVSPEIIKIIDKRWLKVRALEIGEEVVEDNKMESGAVAEPEDEGLPFEKITKLISDLDAGEGVPIEEVIEKSPWSDTEAIIEKMLESGDIFQNQPGKIKVL
jgi:RPA family protein